MDKSFSFYVVTDTHFFEPSLGASGEKYDEYMRTQQMCLAENSAIAKATFEKIAQDTDTDIVIMPGDLTKDGERESHLSLIKQLNALKQAGKKVYVITARHDFNKNPRGYVADKFVPVTGTSREGLYELYRDFGYSQALAVDRETLSYVAQIAPGVRMIAVNSDGSENGEGKGCIEGRLREWIKQQLDTAKQEGCFVFAINHYPIIPPCPMFELVGDAKVRNWRDVASFFADNGVPLAVTGHMHSQSINKFVSEKGNKLYDICTSALVGSPARYRKITVSGGERLRVESFDVPPFEWDMKGMSNKEYFDRQFYTMIRNTIAHTFEKKAFLRPFKKTVFESDSGKICRLLRIPAPEPLAGRNFLELCTEIASNIFDGDQPYIKGTQEYETLSNALDRLSFVLHIAEKKLSKGGESYNLKQMMLDTVGNDTGLPDNNAEFSLTD